MTYWKNVMSQRLSRRRALAVTGGATAAAAFLAACGGSDSGGSALGDTSGLLTKPEDTSGSAKRGGSFKSYATADAVSFEPFLSLAGSSGHPTRAYSRLVRFKPGRFEHTDGTLEGDGAESWEFSPDGLTLTFKLKNNAGFAPIAPVNGRMLDSGDVGYSWKRYAELGVNRSELSNDVSPGAPILSVTTPDPRTVTFKLAYPMYTLIYSLAPSGGGGFILIPKESESQYDVRTKMIGTGPWYLAEYEPSVRFLYKRNPNFYDKTLPYLDEVSMPILSEYSAGLAQFIAGNLHTFEIRPENVVATKRQVAQLAMYQADLSADGLVGHFGWEPTPPEKTPFRDERVRQAFSMSWDRDAYIDTFFNVSQFRSEGLPVETAWNTVFGADLPFSGWWLDPKGRDFGENAKYFQHNIAEAKKLLSAAGNPNPEALSTQRGADSDQITVLEGMASEAGFRFTTNVVNQTEYVRVRDSQGKFQGIAYRGLPSGSSSGGADNLEFLIRSFSIKLGGRNYSGFDVNGRGDFSGDQYLEDMFAKGRGEADANKRKALVHEAQRYLAKKMYSIRWPGGASGFLLRWPSVKNVGVFKDDLRGDDMTLWLDPSADTKS